MHRLEAGDSVGKVAWSVTDQFSSDELPHCLAVETCGKPETLGGLKGGSKRLNVFGL